MLTQPPLPPQYETLTDEEMTAAILEHKRRFGSRLVILGHHYQRDEVIRLADFDGDSLKLSQIGAAQRKAEFIVFCGVHFMAESADILTDDRVKVILPDLSAGCSMADMADIDQVLDAWDFITGECGVKVVPITYVNSAASIKAFCGEHGGACCTSSNARTVIEWAFKQGDRVIFLPDQHLGRNTAYAMVIPLDKMPLYDPDVDNGGLSPQKVRDARVLLWKGYCSVHMVFTPEDCDELRRTDPQCKIIVHPECDWSVVQKADLAGSTGFIIKTINDAQPGSRWAVGTEINLVNRLANRHTDRSVRVLGGVSCLCSTMYQIDLRHLLWVLDELADGRVVNQISVSPEVGRLAIVALERMLANVTPQPAGLSG